MIQSRLVASLALAGIVLTACSRGDDVVSPISRSTGRPSFATSVAGSADLQISGSASTGSPNAGATLSYTFLVKNSGPDAASDVTLTDGLPAGTQYLGATVPAWSGIGGPVGCTATTGGATTVTCGVGAMAKGGQATFVVTVSAPVVAGAFANTGVVSSTTSDPQTANNAASVSAQVKTALVAACPLPAGQTTLHGIVMFTSTTLLPTGPSIQNFAFMADNGVLYWIRTNFYDGAQPLTNVINLDCKTSPAQFISTGGSVTVTGTLGSDTMQLFAGSPPSPTIDASVVQIPTRKDKI